MNDSDDINLDEFTPDELEELENHLEERLRIYFRHLVGIAGAYEHVDAEGNHTPQQPFYYSAAVIGIGGEWFLATAGHNIEKIDAAVTRPDMQLVACGLDDSYVPNASNNEPIMYFDYAGASRFHRNENGLDFGLIHLRQNYRDLLAANGVEPLSETHLDRQKVAECSTFLMVGFPEDSIDAGITHGTSHYHAHVKGRPSVILIERLIDLPEGVSDTQYDRFVGQIRSDHDVGDIAGMSGGPIFCFNGYNFEPYYAAAIQNSWLPKRKITFGCPFSVCLEVARDFIADVCGD